LKFTHFPYKRNRSFTSAAHAGITFIACEQEHRNRTTKTKNSKSVYCKDFEKDRCNSSKMLLNEVVTMWQARPSL